MNIWLLFLVLTMFFGGGALCQISLVTDQLGLDPGWILPLNAGGILLLTPCLGLMAIFTLLLKKWEESRFCTAFFLPGWMLACCLCVGKLSYIPEYSVYYSGLILLCALGVLSMRYGPHEYEEG